jgi:hypothetical protein
VHQHAHQVAVGLRGRVGARGSGKGLNSNVGTTASRAKLIPSVLLPGLWLAGTGARAWPHRVPLCRRLGRRPNGVQGAGRCHASNPSHRAPPLHTPYGCKPGN